MRLVPAGCGPSFAAPLSHSMATFRPLYLPLGHVANRREDVGSAEGLTAAAGCGILG